MEFLEQTGALILFLPITLEEKGVYIGVGYLVQLSGRKYDDIWMV